MKPRQIGASEFVMKKISEMSKEQTPIEKLIDYIKSRGLTSGEKAVLDRWIEEDRAEREQYAQAKVLEALEREVVKFSKHAFKEAKAAVIWSNDYPLHVAKNYIETEVKPKYE